MRLVRESTRLLPRLRSLRFLIITMIIIPPITSTLSGLEAPPNCQRKHTQAKLFSPRTFEATSTQHSGVGVGCSSRPPKNGLRNSKLQTTEHSTLEKQPS